MLRFNSRGKHFQEGATINIHNLVKQYTLERAAEIISPDCDVPTVIDMAMSGNLALSWNMRNNPAQLLKDRKVHSGATEPIDEDKVRNLSGPHRLFFEFDESGKPTDWMTDEWLRSLVTEVGGSFVNTTGILVLDDEDRFWRVLEYRGVSVSFNFSADGSDTAIQTKEGFHPRKAFPAPSELCVRPKDIDALKAKSGAQEDPSPNEWPLTCATSGPLTERPKKRNALKDVVMSYMEDYIENNGLPPSLHTVVSHFKSIAFENEGDSSVIMEATNEYIAWKNYTGKESRLAINSFKTKLSAWKSQINEKS